MSTTAPTPSDLPAAWSALVDDAAVFPPGNAPLAQAVEAHLAHRAAPYAALLGPFVVGDGRLPELVEIMEAHSSADPLAVTVVVSTGAGGIEPATRWAEGADSLRLASLEVALRDPEDLPGNARRVVTASDTGVDVPVYVELPPLPDDGQLGRSWAAAADVVAEAGLRLKLRTGGVTADLFPSTRAVGAFIDAALDREVPFKCTAGLHHAIRGLDAENGWVHHGFLNVLVATRAALDGGDVVAALDERDPDRMLALVDAVGLDALGRARAWFASFGCCGVTDPWADLTALGLVGT